MELNRRFSDVKRLVGGIAVSRGKVCRMSICLFNFSLTRGSREEEVYCSAHYNLPDSR